MLVNFNYRSLAFFKILIYWENQLWSLFYFINGEKSSDFRKFVMQCEIVIVWKVNYIIHISNIKFWKLFIHHFESVLGHREENN